MSVAQLWILAPNLCFELSLLWCCCTVWLCDARGAICLCDARGAVCLWEILANTILVLLACATRVVLCACERFCNLFTFIFFHFVWLIEFWYYEKWQFKKKDVPLFGWVGSIYINSFTYVRIILSKVFVSRIIFEWIIPSIIKLFSLRKFLPIYYIFIRPESPQPTGKLPKPA